MALLNRLIPLVLRLRDVHPPTYHFLVRTGKRLLGSRLGVYPRVMGNEVAAVTDVLRGGQWNMVYGRGLAHERLEADFAEYVGVPHAIAVGTGGLGLAMSMRALGVRPGDEVIHQVDTCSATALSVMNAAGTPIFADIADSSFMLDPASVEQWRGPQTRALIATHMWGNPEDMRTLRSLADGAGIRLIEDACLGLGARVQGRPAGAWGDVGVFSFGCIKPIQGGEGGMIVTGDESLARELRAMRHWGDRTIEYGVRDVLQPAWNGRMSEIVAAVVREQLRGYPAHLSSLREGVARFAGFLRRLPGLSLVLGHGGSVEDSALTQVVLRIDERAAGITKQALWDGLAGRGVQLWHANFEPIGSLGLFKGGEWRQWIVRGDHDRIGRNYAHHFEVADRVYRSTGLGLGKMNFLSRGNVEHLERSLGEVFARAGVPGPAAAPETSTAESVVGPRGAR